MNKVKNLLTQNRFIFLLFSIEILLFLTNYKLGTFFLGWDNLFPELNFAENIKRSVFGVWQENRGLGLLDGMSFSANIIHYFFLYISSFLIPLSLLRYFFLFSMHLLGGIGMYIFLEKCVLPRVKIKTFTKFVSFLGALFYMFSLITVQMFYAPYELFLVHFAFVPWLVNYLVGFLESSKKSDLIKFSVLTLLSTPQAHVPTIFLTYILLISIIILFYLKDFKTIFRKVITIGLIIFSFNAFWGLPFAYSTLSNSEVIIDAKINQLSNENIYLKNKARGGLLDVLYMKGFLLDEVEVNKDGNFSYIMGTWKNYTNNPLFVISATLLLGISLFGFVSGIKSKDKLILSLSASYLIFFIFLATNTPVAGEITEFLRGSNNIFKEIFRFSFTKFSIIYTFCYSIFLTIGIGMIINFVSKVRGKSYGFVVLVFLSLILLTYSAPVFGGNFLYKELRVKIPDEYFQITEYLKTQDANSRIATLPQPTFWSWLFYKWGGRGSGFIWFGIPQPMMERAFDPWSDKNENYYWELSYSIYSKNPQLFRNVLEKYQLEWIMIDKNLYSPSSYRSLFLEEIDSILSANPQIKKVKEVGEISLYHVTLENQPENFIFVTAEPVNILPEYKWGDLDLGFNDFGLYRSESSDIKNAVYYPFRTLFTGKGMDLNNLEITESPDSIIFNSKIPALKNHELFLPNLPSTESLWIDDKNLLDIGFFAPRTTATDENVKVEILRKEGYLSKKIEPSKIENIETPKRCEAFGYPDSGQISLSNEVLKENDTDFLRIKATNAKNCSGSFWIPNLPYKLGYLVKIRSRNISGKALSFWVENTTNKKSDLESYLPKSKDVTTSYFIIPPMNADGVGYTLHFDNVSIGDFESVNDIFGVEVSPIPFDYLTNISFKPKNFNKSRALADQAVKTEHILPFVYKIDLASSKQQDNIKSLVLSQSYNKGWIAIDLSKFPFTVISEHYLINNWANGWKLEDSTEKIVIIFWPQLLQLLGFGIMFSSATILFLRLKRHRD